MNIVNIQVASSDVQEASGFSRMNQSVRYEVKTDASSC